MTTTPALPPIAYLVGVELLPDGSRQLVPEWFTISTHDLAENFERASTLHPEAEVWAVLSDPPVLFDLLRHLGAGRLMVEYPGVVALVVGGRAARADKPAQG